MEEKNELNDIILSKGGSNSNSKKLLLAIAALTLILIIVLVIMNSLKTQTDEKPPQAVVPPAPTSPTEIANDPLFEPVEVIQEGSNTSAATTPSAPQDLGQIAQKIKQESMQNSPVEETTVIQPAVPAQQPKAATQSVSAPVTPAPAKAQSTQKFAQPVVNTPTIKSVKPTETKKASSVQKTAAAPKPAAETAQKTTDKPAAEPAKTAAETTTKPAAKTVDTTGTYYIQVGSFTKEPSKTLFDRLNASGLKYTTVPSGAATKVMVGPFQGEKAARDVLGNVKRNIESGAYIVKG
ncbi:Sporulation domain-containing protein [Sulfuricurvum kujiense DSM 16994]|uniref:Sporulation domain-containing protein n=1 Tax=Sulfuricurvum kujiense (strain ATCC BAA-921 / DSM 16994 / JCM 11577 / YK-1) TaxID=709032 RepID=E4TWY3_SULKY|nr:SPOR domain-containing protein [Sulfuricurvum kujiense]ADR33824.1 Sporulation domain-containing protein [Sulfuricurvum kujiense DSM 16994]